MAEKLGKWASNRGLISKIRPSDGCKGDTVPSTVVRGYDLRKPGGHLGNVGSRVASQSEIDADDSWSGVQFDCDPSGCTREVMGSHTC